MYLILPLIVRVCVCVVCDVCDVCDVCVVCVVCDVCDVCDVCVVCIQYIHIWRDDSERSTTQDVVSSLS